MNLTRTEEQVALAKILRDLLEDASPPERVAEVADGDEAFDRELWGRLSNELGITGLLVPAEHGGAGASWREVAAVLGELGRSLACVPYLSSSVVAVTALREAGDALAGEHLAAVAAGQAIVTVAMGDASGTVDRDRIGVSATPSAGPSGTGWVLEGDVDLVMDGAHADVLVVLAAVGSDEPGWFLVDRTATGLTAQPMEVLDPTRPLATLQLRATPAVRVGADRDAWEIAESVVDAASVALACEQAAAAEHLLAISVAYAKDRLQFGRPIGSFQAVQHKLADLQLIVDRARSAVELAVWAMADAPEQRREAASLAAVVCGEGLRTIATEAIQVHGGIGFTWEHVAHRYFRRAHASLAAFGTPTRHRERLLATIGV